MTMYNFMKNKLVFTFIEKNAQVHEKQEEIFI